MPPLQRLLHQIQANLIHQKSDELSILVYLLEHIQLHETHLFKVLSAQLKSPTTRFLDASNQGIAILNKCIATN